MRLTKSFLVSRQGAQKAFMAQGEWLPALAELEALDDWRSPFAAWNVGKLNSQMAGSLPPQEQLVLLRQSFEAFVRAAKRGPQRLPMTMPLLGAESDAARSSPSSRRSKNSRGNSRECSCA